MAYTSREFATDPQLAYRLDHTMCIQLLNMPNAPLVSRRMQLYERISINGDVGVWFRPSRTAQRVTQRVTRLFLAHSKGRFAADL